MKIVTIIFQVCIPLHNLEIIETVDIEAAFLQSHTINHNVYILPLPEARQDGIIWKLKKTVYGLNDASHVWYSSVKDLLLNNDCK